MARINLLPWRAERRKLRQKEFLTMVGFAVIAAIAITFLISSYYGAQITGQNERNDYLRDQIKQVDKQIKEIKSLDEKKSRLLARKAVIEQLQANRSKMVHLFDSLVRTIPDGVVLTSVKQTGDKLTLQGRSQSNARVSTYMRSLEGAGWMTRPELSIIEARAGDNSLPYVFTLTVMLANPNAPKDEDGDGVPDAPDPASTEAGAAATPTDAAAPADAPAADGAAPAVAEPAAPEPTASGVPEPAADEGDQPADSGTAPEPEPAAPAPDDGGPGK
jgi:type IV pilus assembly protein PilN